MAQCLATAGSWLDDGEPAEPMVSDSEEEPKEVPTTSVKEKWLASERAAAKLAVRQTREWIERERWNAKIERERAETEACWPAQRSLLTTHSPRQVHLINVVINEIVCRGFRPG